MKRAATTDEMNYAEHWISRRGVTLAEENGQWYFGEEMPDPLQIVLDQNYGGGNEATFISREAAVNALAVTLANFKAAAGM